MNNVIGFTRPTITEDYFNKFDDSEIFFKTYERPIYFEGKDQHDRFVIEEYKSIVRMNGNTPRAIGLVGKKYQVIPMKDICHAAEQEFIGALNHDQIKDVYVRDWTAFHGGTCGREYIFPNINAELESSKSNVAFRTIIINGYDGSSSIKVYSGAIDFFCTNGMVSGAYDLVVKRHTSGVQIPQLVKNVKGAIDIFYTNVERWGRWTRKVIDDEAARECFESIPQISERRIAQLMRQFHIEAMAHGRTVWALYSAATYYATHNEGQFKVRETNSDHTHATLIKRETQIMHWTDTDAFLELAA